ncbi:Alpha/Beta hydrolase protein [Gorgonomyces haynaldii]|nr:Alpha/Beta hydrolase protein [Gorgonomyces haynaldii]
MMAFFAMMAEFGDPNRENPFARIVEGQHIQVLPEFELESGHVLKNAPVAYKTWGTLNEDKSNVIVLCHALSGSADAQDWWGPMFGPGLPFDPTVFFIFCGNVFGSPYGSASPVTIDPATNKRYGPNFPLTSIRDDVRAHKMILDHLGVKSVEFCIGGSMGGMQVLEWAFFGKEYVKHFVPIACSGKHSAWCISWGEAQRQSIYSDPQYLDGTYDLEHPPLNGLSAARMAALLTYRSRNSFESRFGRKVMPKKTKEDSPETVHNEGNKIRLYANEKPVTQSPGSDNKFSVFSAQSYLRYQGDKFNKRFDANCYIAITRKLDTHDVGRKRGGFEKALSTLEQPCLVVGIETDGLFTVDEQYELGEAIPNAQVNIISSGEGHDGFLLEFDQMKTILGDFIHKHAPERLTEIQQETTLVVKNSVFGEAEDMCMW